MLVLSALVLASTRQSSSRYELYDHLYSEGYHNDTHITHSPPLLLTIRNALPAVRSVLDVGCSHGWAVEWLWRKGYESAGVDVSSLAVALAAKTRGRPGSRSMPGRGGRCWNSTAAGARRRTVCFEVASATSLPFPSCSFDAIMSTDVLEHLEPSDVRTAVKEFARVARRYLVLKVGVTRSCYALVVLWVASSDLLLTLHALWLAGRGTQGVWIAAIHEGRFRHLDGRCTARQGHHRS